MVNPIPEGHHTLTPYLIVKGGKDAIAFYAKAFNATCLMQMDKPDGTLGHAEIKIGNSMLMLADEMPEMKAHSPQFFGGTPVSLCLYVEDVDTVFEKALAAGGKVVKPVENQFYGDRSGLLLDPFGHVWCIATHIEDVTPEEIEKRLAAIAQH